MFWNDIEYSLFKCYDDWNCAKDSLKVVFSIIEYVRVRFIPWEYSLQRILQYKYIIVFKHELVKHIWNWVLDMYYFKNGYTFPNDVPNRVTRCQVLRISSTHFIDTSIITIYSHKHHIVSSHFHSHLIVGGASKQNKSHTITHKIYMFFYIKFLCNKTHSLA